ncbi:hypothetical protein KSP39_PZI019213 [Platanthera zijinensis]|uniref:Uncharacterized protein n=1 Tax=Platanthera zijinensis TaxID=2320716 RepID=A0AAP0B101_9ASPA
MTNKDFTCPRRKVVTFVDRLRVMTLHLIRMEMITTPSSPRFWLRLANLITRTPSQQLSFKAGFNLALALQAFPFFYIRIQERGREKMRENEKRISSQPLIKGYRRARPCYRRMAS